MAAANGQSVRYDDLEKAVRSVFGTIGISKYYEWKLRDIVS
jgi:hypothetical protein